MQVYCFLNCTYKKKSVYASKIVMVIRHINKITSPYYMLSNHFAFNEPKKIQTISRLSCPIWLISVLLNCKHKTNFLKLCRMAQILNGVMINRRNHCFMKGYIHILIAKFDVIMLRKAES